MYHRKARRCVVKSTGDCPSAWLRERGRAVARDGRGARVVAMAGALPSRDARCARPRDSRGHTIPALEVAGRLEAQHSSVVGPNNPIQVPPLPPCCCSGESARALPLFPLTLSLSSCLVPPCVFQSSYYIPPTISAPPPTVSNGPYSHALVGGKPPPPPYFAAQERAKCGKKPKSLARMC